MQIKTNDRRTLSKKKKKRKTKSLSIVRKKTQLKVKSVKKRKSPRRNKKRSTSSARKRDRSTDTNKSIKITQQNDVVSSQLDEKQQSDVLSKDVAKLKTLYMFEPWIKHDELDVRKLFEFND